MTKKKICSSNILFRRPSCTVSSFKAKQLLAFFKTRMRVFFNYRNIFTVSKLGSNAFNFPAKRLRKNTGAQNTHAPFFLKNKKGPFFTTLIQNKYNNKLKLCSTLLYNNLYCCLLNKIPYLIVMASKHLCFI